MDILEQLVRKVALEFKEKHKADLVEIGAKEISVTKIERLTYEQCIDELVKEGEKLEFGDDLSDSALRRLGVRSEEHTSELQSRQYLVCRLLLEKKKKNN